MEIESKNVTWGGFLKELQGENIVESPGKKGKSRKEESEQKDKTLTSKTIKKKNTLQNKPV